MTTTRPAVHEPPAGREPRARFPYACGVVLALAVAAAACAGDEDRPREQGGADFVLRAVPQRPAPAARGGWLRRFAEFFEPSWSGRARQALEGRIRVHRVA